MKMLTAVTSLLFFSFIHAHPTSSGLVTVASEGLASQRLQNRDVPQAPSTSGTIFPRQVAESLSGLITRSAGFFWGPVEVGNLKFSVLNPHAHPIRPKFPQPIEHFNVHVDRLDPPKALVNLQVVPYREEGTDRPCIYIFNDLTKKALFDSCFDDPGAAVEEAAKAVKNIVTVILDNANFIASVVVIAALVAALMIGLGGLLAVA
jgi:hypothetical protein